MRSLDGGGNLAGAFVSLAIFAGWSVVPAAAQDARPDYEAIVASPDRSDADRQADPRRQPARMLAFAGARPGMKVLDMEANGGLNTPVLGRPARPRGGGCA